jgi:hypothetical protein
VVRACCCHPEAVSFTKLTVAKGLPVEFQICPTWWPTGSLDAFQYLIAIIWPGTALWNFIPSSIDFPSEKFSNTGVCVVKTVSAAAGKLRPADTNPNSNASDALLRASRTHCTKPGPPEPPAVSWPFQGTLFREGKYLSVAVWILDFKLL